MDPILQLNELPFWALALLILVGAELYSLGLVLVYRAAYGEGHLSRNNEVAGFKFAVVGVAYAVLLAFVVIAVWEEYRNTETAVRNEARAVVDLHHLAEALPQQDGRRIAHALASYAVQVREAEWPAMGQGGGSPEAAKALAELHQAVFALQPDNLQMLALYQQALRLLTSITDNRTERLNSANGTVPWVLWMVLFSGALLTLAYPAFFAASNLTAQMLMTAALAALVALALLLAVVLDYPFTGDVQIPSLPFDAALEPSVRSGPV